MNLTKSTTKGNSLFIYASMLIMLAFGMPQSSTAQSAKPTDADRFVNAYRRNGYVETPSASLHRPEDIGRRAHTNILIFHEDKPSFAPRKAGAKVDPLVLNPTPGSSWETPASIACIYNMVVQVSGCPIASTTNLPSGGSVIAIVDAYDDPTAASDLATFSSYFGLPTPYINVIYATGTKPAQDSTGGWELEESLDIEWAHAMAPNAVIELVEAASNSYADLMAAEDVATEIVRRIGDSQVGSVSNSYGGSEFSGESSYDSHFSQSGVMYFASTGDCGFCLEYPALSPNVIAAGGTSIERDGSGNFLGESYWTSGGGGVSVYESRPSFQNTIESIVGSYRGDPDIAAVADPYTGVAVYDSTAYEGTSYGWIQLGGTSVASPILAARANAAATVRSVYPSLYEQNFMYGEYAASTAYPSNFRDITSGSSSCTTGWDICDGIGSPLGVGWLPAAPTIIRPNAYNDLGTDDPDPYDGNDPSTQPNGPLGPHGTSTYNPGDGTVVVTTAVNATDNFSYMDSVESDQQLTGNCTWTFASQTLSNNATLYIPYSFYTNGSYDSATFTVVVTINGASNYTNVYEFYGASDGMLTYSLPSGTNMSNVQVDVIGNPNGNGPGWYSGSYSQTMSMYLDVFAQ